MQYYHLFVESVSSGLITEFRAEAGSQFCIINITVKNMGNQADTFLPSVAWDDDTVAKIIWEQYEYSRTTLIGYKDDLFSETLNPLVSKSGILAFEVPNDVANSSIPPVLVVKAGRQAYQCELIKN